MKYSTPYALVGALVPMASAFPALLQRANQDTEMAARAAQFLGRAAPITADSAASIFEPIPIFNAKAQYVDVSPGSGHEWVAPGPDDNRGPCPGLNAFANHGFLPHNGYATITQFIDATNQVVGMGLGLAAFLAAFGAGIDGDGTAWSIGGTPTVAQAGVLGNEAHGISGSHNKYESDSSPTRPDLYETGNDYKIQLDQFQDLVNMSPGGLVTMDSLTKFRSYRFDTQIANNPYFFNGPFTGVLVQPAAYTFIYRFMANHTAENTEGVLDIDVLKSWFGVYGDSGSYTKIDGYERIPDNWYKRAVEYPYENTYFVADAANAIALYPKFADIGGNMGKVNTFAGVNVEDLSGGVMNAQDLTQGNNAACLGYQFAAQAQPDVVQSAAKPFTSALSALLGPLSCPQLQHIDADQLKQFPGYRQ